MPDRCDVLLVTVTDVETRAVIEQAEQHSGRRPHEIFGQVKTYFDLGLIGGAQVMLVRSEMGSDSPGGAAVTARDALFEIDPRAVIMVGTAFGVERDKQPIGHVLVSRQLQSYESSRIGTDHDTGAAVPISRGDRVTASELLLDRLRTASLDWTKATVDFGMMLSGAKLIDNIGFRDALLDQFPEAIGGEMEGAGLYAAVRGREWIIVKAVCDWADGRKAQQKQVRQRRAARLAANFVFHTIAQGGLARVPDRAMNPAASEHQAQPESVTVIVYNEGASLSWENVLPSSTSAGDVLRAVLTDGRPTNESLPWPKPRDKVWLVVDGDPDEREVRPFHKLARPMAGRTSNRLVLNLMWQSPVVREG